MVLIKHTQKLSKVFSLVLIFKLCSCTLFKGTEGQEEDIEAESDYEYYEEDGIENPPDPFAFPKEANAWETQALLLSQELPASDQIQNCSSDISLAAKEANNDEALLTAKKTVLASVKENPNLYHWCFFLIARQMDSQIEASGKRLNEKVEYFLGKMKELWILGRALDAHRSGNSYFTYLQRRYVDLSQRVFGRYLEVVGSPLDRRPTRKKTQGKPAEEAEIN
ncbi:MAG: hypothetical protein AB8G05_03485 [Oligoflexales bacterium]